MDNMGGLNQLSFIDADDVVSLQLDEDNVYNLILEGGKAPHEIAFTEDTGKLSENENNTDENGVFYSFEASCRVPNCSESNSDIIGEYRKKKLLILGKDNNERLWLAGYPGSYFDFNLSSDTGGSNQEVNGRTIKISASLPNKSVFINPSEIIPAGILLNEGGAPILNEDGSYILTN
jgi:hypothetical protein